MRLPLLVGLLAATAACGGENKSGPGGASGGAASGRGGENASGATASGGASSSGGASMGAAGTSDGGAAPGGAAIGGVTSGAAAVGGAITGGAVSSGGATNSGGAVTGGSTSAGGAAAGRANTGGATSGGATKGDAGSGGTSSGGVTATGGAASGGTKASGGGAACGQCAAYAAAKSSGTVEPADLSALSGLAVSRSQPDILFTHNDHQAVLVFALDLQGREHARISASGVTATDIEDIAVGPCGAETCVYLSDTGDNNSQRTEYAVLRFVAPTVPTSAGSTTINVTTERFRFTYEDGSHNGESLMVGPDGTVYLVSKLAPGSGGRVLATGPSSIYRLPTPLSTASVARATKVLTLAVPRTGEGAASAAAAHPCGTGFLLRTYDRVFEFAAPSGMPFEAAFSVTPREIEMGTEPQSEAIDYRMGGRGFVTSGEGSHAPILVTDCAQ